MQILLVTRGYILIQLGFETELPTHMVISIVVGLVNTVFAVIKELLRSQSIEDLSNISLSNLAT